LPHKATNLTISAGDVMILETAGGGGWGSPFERDPKLVLADVIDGKLSSEAAQRSYGVVIKSSSEIDITQTEQRRRATLSRT
jgi:N-methylhydantoinase B/oxoprolinase/acetone carboxylase alpha subunit